MTMQHNVACKSLDALVACAKERKDRHQLYKWASAVIAAGCFAAGAYLGIRNDYVPAVGAEAAGFIGIYCVRYHGRKAAMYGQLGDSLERRAQSS